MERGLFLTFLILSFFVLSTETLSKHIAEIHGKEETECKVSGCRKKFKSFDELHKHIVIVHSNFDGYECLQCGMRSAFYDSFSSHMLVTHKKPVTWKDRSYGSIV